MGRPPVDGIELDHSVVRGVDGAPRRRQLVSGLVALCREMGITTLAEGWRPRADLVELLGTRGHDLAGGAAADPTTLPRWPATSR